jgi:hypothetical protein
MSSARELVKHVIDQLGQQVEPIANASRRSGQVHDEGVASNAGDATTEKRMTRDESATASQFLVKAWQRLLNEGRGRVRGAITRSYAGATSGDQEIHASSQRTAERWRDSRSVRNDDRLIGFEVVSE